MKAGNHHHTCLGVTGSGKTFTIAKVVATIKRQTLGFSRNQTLAARLYSERKALLPHNAVEYFDCYQPEVSIPGTDALSPGLADIFYKRPAQLRDPTAEWKSGSTGLSKRNRRHPERTQPGIRPGEERPWPMRFEPTGMR